MQVAVAPLGVFEHLGWDAVRRRSGADRVESFAVLCASAVIGEREEVLRHPGNAQGLVEIARGILRVLSGGQDEAGREAVLVQARERGDRGLPDLPAAPASVFSGSRTTSSVSGTPPQRVFRWRKVSAMTAAYSSGSRAWETLLYWYRPARKST